MCGREQDGGSDPRATPRRRLRLGRQASRNSAQAEANRAPVAGLSLAYLAELRDTSFRTAAEVRRSLGLPVIGHIPYFKPEKARRASQGVGTPPLDPMLCAYHCPASAEAEAYRGVRTALFFGAAAGPGAWSVDARRARRT